jgi:hypothetical protein
MMLLALLTAVMALLATAQAQYRGQGRGDQQGYVQPQWNRQGSAVCPNGYDFDAGWCKPREERQGRRGGYRGYGRSDAMQPRWNSRGSAVCPEGYDYVREACRPRSAWRLPPTYNSRGSAVCPSGYDFRGGWCRPQD